LWITVVLAIAAQTRPENAPHFGLVRQHYWACFLLGVAPLLVLHAARRAAPARMDDPAWLKTRRASNVSIALSTYAGALVAWSAATLACAAVAELDAPPDERLSIACGTAEVPTGRWFGAEAPLAWRATIPAGSGARSATFEIGLGAAGGSAGKVLPRAGGREGRILVLGGRGEIEVGILEGETAVEFELQCIGEGTRALVLAPHATLWAQAESRFSACVSIALRFLLAGATWLALALAFACFAGGTTAACGVLALWVPVWMSDWPASMTRWIPGADLFEALAIVGAGRAPAAPPVHAWIGTFVLVGCAVVASAFGLRRWRVSR
jgi:hypothetical protein